MHTLNLIPYIYERLSLFILVFTRISAFFSTFILFGKSYVNARVIIAFTSLLTFYVLLLEPNSQFNHDVFSIPMFIQVTYQVLIGFVAGLVLNIVFEIFSGVGQIVSTQVGLSMVTLIDPRFGVITPLTLFYAYVAIIVFLFLNGHLLTIKMVIDSFHTLPVNHIFFTSDTVISILKYTNVIFQGSALLSITILTSMLLTNLTMAMMTRFAPQFNIFSIGINISIILGLIIVYATFGAFLNNSSEFLREGLQFLQNLLTGMT